MKIERDPPKEKPSRQLAHHETPHTHFIDFLFAEEEPPHKNVKDEKEETIFDGAYVLYQSLEPAHLVSTLSEVVLQTIQESKFSTEVEILSSHAHLNGTKILIDQLDKKLIIQIIPSERAAFLISKHKHNLYQALTSAMPHISFYLSTHSPKKNGLQNRRTYDTLKKR